MSLSIRPSAIHPLVCWSVTLALISAKPAFMNCDATYVYRKRVVCPRPTVRNDIVTPRYLFFYTNSGKIKNETNYLANFCWTEDINLKKSMTVWKLCERSFKWDISGHSSFIRLEMAQEWIKTFPYSVLQFNWIKRFWKEVVHFFKWFELQIWDWSWMKENSKIFEKTLRKKVQIDFFLHVSYELTKRCSFFNMAFTLLTIYSLSLCHF